MTTNFPAPRGIPPVGGAPVPQAPAVQQVVHPPAVAADGVMVPSGTFDLDLSTVAIHEQSMDDLLLEPHTREFMMLVAKDGIGKTSAVLSIARALWYTRPGNTMWIIDTERGVIDVARAWGQHAPRNVRYFHCGSMEEVLKAFQFYVLPNLREHDWVVIESMSALWEQAQSLAYRETTGQTKQEYLATRRAKVQAAGGRTKGLPVIPSPDDFWKIAKGAHDDGICNVLRSAEIADRVVNVIWTALIGKPPRERANRQDSRKEFRDESGMDMNILGAPAVPGWPNTLVELSLIGGKVYAKVVKDRKAIGSSDALVFPIENAFMFSDAFETYVGRPPTGISEIDLRNVMAAEAEAEAQAALAAQAQQQQAQLTAAGVPPIPRART